MDARTAKVDELFAQWDRPDSPGCAVGIIQDGQLIYARGYGMANLDHDIPITADSAFYLCSTSKQFTAACIALLALRGVISLDDNIRKYLPEIPEYGTPITIRHLMHHSSGLRDCLELMTLAGKSLEDYFDNQDIIEILSRQRALNFIPGAEYQYSNSGYVLMAEIVKRATGQSLREFADETIFRPLGMHNTMFDDDRRRIVKQRVESYQPKAGGGYERFIKNFDMVGDGGLLTTVRDLSLWDQNFYDRHVGGNEFIDLMLTRGRLNNGREIFYAFGLGHEEYRGLKLVAHQGGLFGFRTDMVRFPDQRFTVICLANVGTIDPSQMARRVADIFLADQFPEAVPARRTPAHVTDLADRVGLYWNFDNGRNLELTLAADNLMATAFGATFQLVPVSETHFVPVDGPFEMDVLVETRPDLGRSVQLRFGNGREDILQFVAVASPLTEQLVEYAGEYYSDELQAIYRVVVREDELYIEHKRSCRGPFKPGPKDRFRYGSVTLTFERDARGKIAGFKLTTERVRNLELRTRARK